MATAAKATKGATAVPDSNPQPPKQWRSVTVFPLNLSADDVKAIIDKFQDESKPDPLVSKQMRTWALEWIPDDDDENDSAVYQNEEDDPLEKSSETTGLENAADEDARESHEDALATGDGNHRSPVIPLEDDRDAAAPTQYVVSGKLVWRGEHVAVTLNSRCTWSDGPSPHLDYTCRVVSAQLHDGVRPGFADRLRRDAYVGPLLALAPDSSSSSPLLLLCEAHIRPGRERYRTDPDAAEGIRRALWSASATTVASGSSVGDDGGAAVLDVFDFLLQCVPLLPVPPSPNSAVTTTTTTTTPLAERAQLRLLEDAMCDACEREGDEALVEDLSLHRRSPGGDRSEDEQATSSSRHPHGKRAKHR